MFAQRNPEEISVRGQDDKTTGFKSLEVKIHKPVKMPL